MLEQRRLTRGAVLAAGLGIAARILKPLVFVRLVRFGQAFGYVLRSPMYYLLLKEQERARRARRRFDIAFWNGETPDREIAKMWCRQIRLVQDPLPKFLTRLLIVVAWYWQQSDLMKEHVLDFSLPAQMNSEILNTAGLRGRLRLAPSEVSDVRECLRELGIPSGSPVVLLHVRDGSHDLHSSSEFDTQCAGASTASFQSSVDYLRDMGYSVLTFGNHPSSQTDLKGVNEYHRSEGRRALRDITLASAARLYMGTAAGAPSGAAVNFRVPTLLTNHLIVGSNHAAEFMNYGMSIIIPKNFRKSGALLAQSECFAQDLPISDRGLARMGVTAEDNDPQDILSALKELLAILAGEDSWESMRQSSEQIAFFRVFDQHVKLPRVAKTESAVISPSFLRKYPHWLR